MVVYKVIIIIKKDVLRSGKNGFLWIGFKDKSWGSREKNNKYLDLSDYEC